ncbi:MAG: hypothetical protein M1840_002418, partial [Geoglossum simile]
MIETAIKSTPNATPMKVSRLREKEINHFKNEVWLNAYDILVLDLDNNMNDAID